MLGMINCVLLEAMRILSNYRVAEARNGYTLFRDTGLSLVLAERGFMNGQSSL
jgi:hypothetical protein